MAWGQSGGLGVDTAAADAYGGNRGEVETAGGIEMGGAAAAADLANALADALAGGDYYDPGAVAAQDIAAQQAEGVMDIEGDLLGMEADERFEAAQAAAPATGVVEDFSGYTQAGLAPSAYAAGQKYGGEQPSVESFGQSWQTAVAPTQATQTGDYLSPGEQERIAAQGAGISPMANVGTGPELFGGYQGAVAQGYNFGPTQQGHPDFPGSAGVFGTGVEDFTGMPTGTMGQGGVSMIAPANVGGYGLINQGATGPMESTGGQGAITAGTVSSSPEDAATEAAVAAGTAGTTSPDFWANADEQAVMSQKHTSAVKKSNSPEANTSAYKNLAQQRLDYGKMLEEKAKTDPYGRVLDKFGNKTTVTNRQLAKAYNAFDSTLEAYAVINGTSKLGSFISAVVPGVSMIGGLLSGIKDFLVGKGIYDKTSAQDIAAMIQDKLASGEPLSSGEGGMEVEMAVQEEVSSFIQRYPWAAELDPRYIKYLIDNPAELQDLLGQNAGG